jgi:hypothetical protein
VVWAEVFSEDGDEVELCVVMGEGRGGCVRLGWRDGADVRNMRYEL